MRPLSRNLLKQIHSKMAKEPCHQQQLLSFILGEHMSGGDVGMCVRTYAYVCPCVDGIKVNFGCLSSLLSNLFWGGTGSLTEPEAY